MTRTERWRVAAVSAALTALAVVQDPGFVVNDTKIDLALRPGGFLERALHLWDPTGSFGQVQNQAYGYLFPMGPFFWIGDLVDVPDWLVQRLWWALLLVVAFTGVVKLCHELGVGTPSSRLIAGVAFALSPRILTVIGPSSIEVWPMALAPWVLVPLLIGLRRGDPRRWAAVAALVVAACGGVNAAATAAVLPLGVLLLLFADPGRRRRSLMIWWPTFTLVVTAWWWIPLLLLGSVSPPFLDFIESATTTTFAAHPFDALRGVTNWIPYLDRTQTAGFDLVTNPALIVNGTVVLALGVWGIARIDVPRRTWLVSGVLLGLVLVTLGNVDAGWGQAGISDLLDGALAPIRNTHKFDVVLRLPLVIGLAHVIAVVRPAPRPRPDGRPRRVQLVGTAVLAAVALGTAVTPAWSTHLARQGAFIAVPDYWDEATEWMDENAADQNTLVLPGSAFGDYLWGRPRDELVQALASTPWSMRNAVPLVPPSAIRHLDALEEAFGSGRGSTALADLLRRSGIRYLMIRNDMSEPGTTDPELVYSTLSSTPGVERVASFGPRLGNPPSQQTDDDELVFINGGRQSRHDVIEVFEVADTSAGTARAQQLDETPVLVGAPAAQLLGLFGVGTDVLLAQDVPDSLVPSRIALTDTDRRQEVAFGRVTDNRSASIAENEEFRIDRPVHDYVGPEGERWKSVPELDGAERIDASSSTADVTTPNIDRARSPWAAFDGDPTTTWVADDLDGWISIDYGREVSLDGATVTMPAGTEGRDVEVRTDDGAEIVRLRPGRPVAIGDGMTRTLRIGLPETSLVELRISDVTVPDAPVSRPLRLPRLPAGWASPTDVVLTADQGAPTCWRVVDVTRCVPGRDGRGEDGSTIDRIVTLDSGRLFAAGVSVLPFQSEALTSALSPRTDVKVSSTSSVDPAVGPLAMMDGDPETGWIASLDDTSPVLDVDLAAPTQIDRVRLAADATLAASAPRRGTVTFDDGSRQRVTFDADGIAQFDARTTSSLEIEITDLFVRSSLGFDGSGTGLPLGVSELSFPGTDVDPASDASVVRTLPCGSGPDLTVGDRTLRTAVTASRTAVVARVELPAEVCGGADVPLQAGDNRITLTPSRAFRPVTARLSQGPSADVAGTDQDVERNGRDSFTISGLGEGSDRLVAVPQTFNTGWSAGDAETIQVNGWMQGFVTTDGEVDAGYGPATPYRLGLVAGLLAVLGVVGWLWRSSARPFDDRPTRRRVRVRRAVVAAAGVLALGVVGGWLGVAVGLAGTAAAWALGRRAAGLAALLVVGSGLAYAWYPWNAPRGWAGDLLWPQLLVLCSLGLVAGVGLRRRPIRESLSRSAGRSTSR